MNDLILDLYKKDCIKLGNFKLKNNDTSPIYIDLKNIISFPYIVNSIVSLFSEKILKTNFSKVCGIPYGGMHIASIVSYKYNYPLLLLRKETKAYGMKKNIEGQFKDDEKCIVFEDVITTGSSLVQYLKIMKRHKLVVNDIFVICDRKHAKNDELLKYNLHVLFTMYDILNILMIDNVINTNQLSQLTQYVNKNGEKTYKYSYEYRKKLTQNKILKDLFEIIISKQSLLILDCSQIKDQKTIIQYLSLVGKHISILYINGDNISKIFMDGLHKLSLHHNFKIMTYVNCFDNLESHLDGSLIQLDALKVDNERLKYLNLKYTNYGFVLNTNIDQDEHIENTTCKYGHECAKENKNLIIGISCKSIKEKDQCLIYMAPDLHHSSLVYDNQTTGIYQHLFEKNIDMITLGSDFLKIPHLSDKIELLKKMTWTIYLSSIRYDGNNFTP